MLRPTCAIIQNLGEMKKEIENRRFTLSDALKQLPGPSGERFATVFKHGLLEIEIYAPRGVDPQKPHTRDEVYVVVQGKGTFFNGDSNHPFESGDVIFVPAGVEHRFLDFTEDLIVWAFFYGPEP